MKVKVAFDANVPERVVMLLRSGFSSQHFELLWEPDFANAHDADEVWIEIFKRGGGDVIVSGDKNIAKRPHQIAAISSAGLRGYFLHRVWCNGEMTFKTAYMFVWMPIIIEHLAVCRPGQCWWIPGTLRKEAPFKAVKVPGV